jgi:hypothetical protein
MQVAKLSRQPFKWSPRATWYALGFPKGWLTRTCGMHCFSGANRPGRKTCANLALTCISHKPSVDVAQALLPAASRLPGFGPVPGFSTPAPR